MHSHMETAELQAQLLLNTKLSTIIKKYTVYCLEKTLYQSVQTLFHKNKYIFISTSAFYFFFFLRILAFSLISKITNTLTVTVTVAMATLCWKVSCASWFWSCDRSADVPKNSSYCSSRITSGEPRTWLNICITSTALFLAFRTAQTQAWRLQQIQNKQKEQRQNTKEEFFKRLLISEPVHLFSILNPFRPKDPDLNSPNSS